jgi:hypothetical protein
MSLTTIYQISAKYKKTEHAKKPKHGGHKGEK